MKFVRFTAPDGQMVAVVVDQIGAVRAADVGTDRRAHAVIVLASGVLQAVRETQDEVIRTLEVSSAIANEASKEASKNESSV